VSRKLVKLSGVLSLSAQGRSTVYKNIKKNLFPPPIKIGERAVAWIEDEIEQLIYAQIRGDSESEIKQLVSDLITSRSSNAINLGDESCPK
jgi:prophage regulatory protein